MGGEGVEIGSQSVGGEGGNVTEKQAMLDIVGEGKGTLFSALADVQGRDRFADRIDGESEPGSGSAAAHTSVEFIELKHGKNQITKQVVVPTLRVVAHAVEPASDGGVGMTGEAEHDGHIDALGDKPERYFDPFGSRFEVIERCAETRGKDFAAHLTLETRDMVVMTVANEGVDGFVGDAAGVAVRIRAGKAVSGDGFLATARAFGLRIGDNIALLDELQAHLMATKMAVMRRGRLPLTLFEGFPVLVKPFTPTTEIGLDKDKNDDQQDKLG